MQPIKLLHLILISLHFWHSHFKTKEKKPKPKQNNRGSTSFSGLIAFAWCIPINQSQLMSNDSLNSFTFLLRRPKHSYSFFVAATNHGNFLTKGWKRKAWGLILLSTASVFSSVIALTLSRYPTFWTQSLKQAHKFCCYLAIALGYLP